jgi:hypothetical protein
MQYRSLPELFPVGSICFMLGDPYYGSQGKVVEISDAQVDKCYKTFTRLIYGRKLGQQ